MKYILILGESSESAVDEMIHWIHYLSDEMIVRINTEDSVDLLNVDLSSNGPTRFTIALKDNLYINSAEIAAYYYRRGEFYYHNIRPHRDKMPVLNSLFYRSARKYYNEEWEHISHLLHFLLQESKIPSLNSFFDNKCNKLINLEIAKQCGLLVPETLISNDPDTLRQFLLRHGKVIVKPIRYPGFKYQDVNHQFLSYSQPSSLFTLEHLSRLLEIHTTFQPTQFQAYVKKEFEIRSYYLKGTFYSMAIFSQNDPQTQIDFRNYNTEKPNRNVPFLLPENIEAQTTQFMQKMGYDSGSLDFIYSDGKYVFLEVNTVGIFQWVSKYCNYYIEKQLAKHLIHIAHEPGRIIENSY